jgi:lysozyme
MTSSLMWDGKTLPAQARQLIEIGEACVLRPYLDSTGVPTIGWGSTTMPDGERVTMHARALTQAEADAMLDRQLEAETQAVASAITVAIPESAAAALVDFSHNLGLHALTGSMIRTMILGGRCDLAADQLGCWVMAGGRIDLGLMRRREMERRVWVGAEVDAAHAQAWAMSETALLPAYHKALADAAAWKSGRGGAL